QIWPVVPCKGWNFPEPLPLDSQKHATTLKIHLCCGPRYENVLVFHYDGQVIDAAIFVDHEIFNLADRHIALKTNRGPDEQAYSANSAITSIFGPLPDLNPFFGCLGIARLMPCNQHAQRQARGQQRANQ